MRIMLTGDVVGHAGRKAFCQYTPQLRREKHIDVVVVNGENSAGGKGFTRGSLDELYRGGADIVTSGNHVWDKKDVLEFIDDEPFLIRPANYPEGTPGKGCCIYPFKAKNIGVMNLSGRTFMPALDCPFQKVEDLLRELRDECDILLLDFHAEATSEKMAMGWYLDGRGHAYAYPDRGRAHAAAGHGLYHGSRHDGPVELRARRGGGEYPLQVHDGPPRALQRGRRAERLFGRARRYRRCDEPHDGHRAHFYHGIKDGGRNRAPRAEYTLEQVILPAV